MIRYDDASAGHYSTKSKELDSNDLLYDDFVAKILNQQHPADFDDFINSVLDVDVESKELRMLQQEGHY